VSVDDPTTFKIGSKGVPGQGAGADNDGVPGIAQDRKTI